jgi:inner membrane protein
MATLVTHAALPFIVSGALDLDPRERTRVTVAAAIVSCLPDLDTLSFLADVPARDPWGHRGGMHSIVFGLLLGAAAMLFLPRRPRIWAFVLGAAVSHGLIDFFTHGDLGVALFAPFTAQRFLFPWGPIAVSPLGVDEMLGRFGALVLLNEALVVLLPAWLIVRAAQREPARLVTGIWLVSLPVAGLAMPGLLQPLPRPLEAYVPEDPDFAPLRWLPSDDGGVVTRFDELKARGLFDTELSAAQTPWSSSFFPSWYGGEAGRWQDPRSELVLRTLRGVTPPSPEELKSNALDVERLSPLEKYDLAVGAYDLPATKKTLAFTHNGHPRYWHGLCNGVATAAMNNPEPFRTVDVVNPDGIHVRFLPNDTKALLAASYFWMSEVVGLKLLCGYVGLDSGRVCSMNAGAAVLATLNRLGIDRSSYLVDVHPSRQAQLYAVARGRVSIRKGPYAYDGAQTSKRLSGKVTQLLDVDLTLILSSTTLPYAPANRPTVDPTRYEKVGLVPATFTWPATLALGADGEILGGRWTGVPPDGPDTFLFTSGGPEMLDGGAGTLAFNPWVKWSNVQKLAAASVDDDAGTPMAVFDGQ